MLFDLQVNHFQNQLNNNQAICLFKHKFWLFLFKHIRNFGNLYQKTYKSLQSMKLVNLKSFSKQNNESIQASDDRNHLVIVFHFFLSTEQGQNKQVAQTSLVSKIIVGFFCIQSLSSYLDIAKNQSKFKVFLFRRYLSIFSLAHDCQVVALSLLRSIWPFYGSQESKASLICKIWFWLSPCPKYFCIGKAARFALFVEFSEFPIKNMQAIIIMSITDFITQALLLHPQVVLKYFSKPFFSPFETKKRLFLNPYCELIQTTPLNLQIEQKLILLQSNQLYYCTLVMPSTQKQFQNEINNNENKHVIINTNQLCSELLFV